jgi:integrase/recombinase XerD
MSWDTYIKQFKNYLKIESSLAGNSVDAYIRDVNKLYEFMQLSGSSIDPTRLKRRNLQEFINYVNELGLSPYSQARIISGLKSFYRFLALEDLIDEDPTALLESPRLGRKLPHVLSLEEINSLLDAIDMSRPDGHRNRAILEILYSSGLRVSELVNLKLNNIFWDIQFFRIL